MLSKQNLEDMVKCNEFGLSCSKCSNLGVIETSCQTESAITALQLLERVETAKTIFNDLLSSGNVKSCEKEIKGFLEVGD